MIPGPTRAAVAVLAVLAAMGLTWGCSIFPPIGELERDRLSVDWAAPLYELEPFAYEPQEAGRTLFVKSKSTPDAGMVVVPAKDRTVRGIDAASGAILWTLKTRGPNVAQPTAVGDELLIGSYDGHVYRTYQRNGRPIWVSEYPGKAGIHAAPVAGDGRVFVTSIDNRLTALSFDTGAKLWDRRRPHANEFSITGQAGAVIHDGKVITGFSDGSLTAFAAEDGATAWTTDLSGGKTEFVDVDTTPVVVDDVVVASSYKRGLYGVDAATGNVVWLVKGEGYLTPAVAEGMLYVPEAAGRMVAVSATDGAVQWVARFPSGWATTPAVTRSYVLAPTGDALVLLDRGSGRAVLRYGDGRGVAATPHVAMGTAYVLANSGTLYALGIY